MAGEGFKVTKGRSEVTVAVVAYPGAQKAAVYGLVDLLASAARLNASENGTERLRVVLVDPSEGLESPARPFTALVLPPSLGDGSPPRLDEPLRHWLLARHGEGTTLCSVCVGAFLLAELGLLDGRPATTHWGVGDAFEKRHPEVRLDTSRLVVDDGDIITAGGLMAWVDLGLKLVARFLGPSTMLATARFFIVDPGGREQRFYSSFSPLMTHGDDAILKVQRWLQANVGASTSVEAMAALAGLGRRTFLRRFTKATGLKTTAYIHHLCVARARDLLESTAMSQQEVAWEVGYEDAGAFRRMFIKIMGLSPAEYRRRFGTLAGTQEPG